MGVIDNRIKISSVEGKGGGGGLKTTKIFDGIANSSGVAYEVSDISKYDAVAVQSCYYDSTGTEQYVNTIIFKDDFLKRADYPSEENWVFAIKGSVNDRIIFKFDDFEHFSITRIEGSIAIYSILGIG